MQNRSILQKSRLANISTKLASIRRTHSFQSGNREIDICIVKSTYNWFLYQSNDFIWPIGSYDFHFISGVPPERNEYLTLVLPYDSFTWAFIIASLVGVTITLILIDKLQANWTKQPSNDTVFQCKSEVGIIIQVPLIILFY